MKILYIGGTGEISYECVKRDVEMGRQVAVFNRGQRPEPLPASVRRIAGELDDQAAYAALGKDNWDVVCQFLAYDIARVRRDVEVFAGRCGQYVFISSASAYQKPPPRIVVTEATPLDNPYWPYSRAKAEMERYLMDQHAAGKIPVTVVRPSHTYRTRFPGGDEWPWRIERDLPVIMHGDGTSLWTLTHSSDFAGPFCNLLGNPAALGQAFHITRHLESYTWDDILAAAGRALGRQPKVVHVPTDTLVKYNPDWVGPYLGDKTWSVMFDNSKVMSVAGTFTCRVGLDEGLAGAADSYRKRSAAGSVRMNADHQALLDRIAAEQAALGG
jgi:nucleoside-diphosphate-sugar epimerase